MKKPALEWREIVRIGLLECYPIRRRERTRFAVLIVLGVLVGAIHQGTVRGQLQPKVKCSGFATLTHLTRSDSVNIS